MWRNQTCRELRNSLLEWILNYLPPGTSEHQLAKHQGEAVAALIDGLWLRCGLSVNGMSPKETAVEVEYFIRVMLNR